MASTNRDDDGRETSSAAAAAAAAAAPGEEEEEEEVVRDDEKQRRMYGEVQNVNGAKGEEKERGVMMMTSEEEEEEERNRGERRRGGNGRGRRGGYFLSDVWTEVVHHARTLSRLLRQYVMMLVNAVISQPFILAVLGIAHLHIYFCLRTYARKFHGIEDDLKLVRLHSEQAFYYSYYNDLVRAPNIARGIQDFIEDSRSEHPDTINALQRFNIAPELILGLIFRQADAVRSLLGVQALLDPFAFYCLSVFALHSLQSVIIMTLTATLLGSRFADNHADSLTVTLHSTYNMYAAVIAGIWLLGNFDNVSRVGMASLRENFALPFLWLQILCIVSALKIATRSPNDTDTSHGSEVDDDDDNEFRNTSNGMDSQLICLLFVASVGFLVPWQLSPFIVLTQILALMSSELFTALLTPQERLHTLGDTFLQTHRTIVVVIICAFAVTTCIQFGNRMLLASQAVSMALAYEASHILFGFMYDMWRGLQQRRHMKEGATAHDASTDYADDTSASVVPSMHPRAQILCRLALTASLYIVIRKLIFALLFAGNDVENGDASHIWGLLLGIIYKLNNNSAPFFALSRQAMQRGDGVRGIGAWLTQYFRDASERFEVKMYLKESVFLPTPPKVWKELLSTGASTALLPLVLVFYFLSQEMWIGALRKLSGGLPSSRNNNTSTQSAEGVRGATNGHARVTSPPRSNGHATTMERGRPKNAVILLEPDLVYMACQGRILHEEHVCVHDYHLGDRYECR